MTKRLTIRRTGPSGNAGSAHEQFLTAYRDDITPDQLASSPVLGLAVDQHAALTEQQLDVRAHLDRVGELEKLTQPDDSLSSAHFAHGFIIAHRRGHGSTSATDRGTIWE